MQQQEVNQKPTTGATLTVKVRLGNPAGQSKRLALDASETDNAMPAPVGRIPRLSRLMALAIRFDALLRAGEVKDYAELARLGHVTRARVTQIMNLLNLAPDLQEQLLFLPEVQRGRDPLKEWQVRPVAADYHWKKQRVHWNRIAP